MRKPYLECNSGAGCPEFYAMGLSPLWRSMGLDPLSIYASLAQWRYAILCPVPYTFTPLWGWPPGEAMHLIHGKIYQRYLAPCCTRLPMEPCS